MRTRPSIKHTPFSVLLRIVLTSEKKVVVQQSIGTSTVVHSACVLRLAAGPTKYAALEAGRALVGVKLQ